MIIGAARMPARQRQFPIHAVHAAAIPMNDVRDRLLRSPFERGRRFGAHQPVASAEIGVGAESTGSSWAGSA